MIYIRLQGGLGNQLFQIFTVLAYSLEYNQPYRIINPPYNPKRPTYWSSLMHSIPKENITSTHNPFVKQIKETSFSYEHIGEKPYDFELNGYYQSYLYFDKHFDTIFKNLNIGGLTQNVKSKCAYMFANGNPTVSMHFRRGDYKSLPQFHPLATYKYYSKALHTVLGEYDLNQFITVLVFCEEEDLTDVTEMVTKLLRFYGQRVTFISVNSGIVDYEQMLLMSVCDHNIIANSTFSYFGAYFNQNEDKIVCYPATWFGPALASHDTTNLCPSTWIKVYG